MLRNVAKIHGNGTFLLCKMDAETKSASPIGTAFLCHGNGYLLTSAHAITLSDTLCVVAIDQKNDFVPLAIAEPTMCNVTISQYDAINDVALLKFPPEVTVSVPNGIFADEREIELGASSGYIGFPFGDTGLHIRHIAVATVSAKVLSSSGTRQYQLDATVHEGCSGGPIIDVRSGKIFGIISGRYSPIGGGAGIWIGGRPAGTDSSIGYATSIAYGVALMKEEGLHV